VSRTQIRAVDRGVPGEAGFATPEWLLGIGLIIMPVIVIVASIAPWYQRANMATLIAQETARIMVLTDDWDSGEAAARTLALEIAGNPGTRVPVDGHRRHFTGNDPARFGDLGADRGPDSRSCRTRRRCSR
jgi:hypothetical protein